MSKVINLNRFKARKEVSEELLKKIDEDKENYFNLSEENKKNYYLLRYIFDDIKDKKYILRIINEELLNEKITGIKKMYILEFLIKGYSIICSGDIHDIEEGEILKLKSRIDAIKQEYLRALGNLYSKDFGLGFGYLQKNVGYSDTIIEFFANAFIFDKIFDEINISAYLKKNYESFEDFLMKNKDLTHFIIQYIGQRDVALAGYIVKNKYFISKILRVLETVKEEWTINDQKINRRITAEIDSRIISYIYEMVKDNEDVLKWYHMYAYFLNNNFKILEKFYSKEQAEAIIQEWKKYNINETIEDSNEYIKLKSYVEEVLKEYGLSKNGLRLVRMD